MANLCITSACNRRCSYCFSLNAGRAGPAFMSLETFGKALDFLVRSGIDQARLLGGEPTLHPEFVRLAESVLRRGLRLLVFSNGFMPEDALSWLEKAPAESVGVLINVSPHGSNRQRETLVRLGRLATLGFNMHSPAFQPDFLLDLIRRCGLSPTIRFGLAHPCADAFNVYLHPKHYDAVGSRLAIFAAKAQSSGVQLQFDCGFVPCMFPPGSLDSLGPSTSEIGLRCSPVLDLLPNGKFVSCFPLSELHQATLQETETAAVLRDRFNTALAGRRILGVFRKCASCEVRALDHCLGGCLAAASQRLRPSLRAEAETGKAKVARWVLPYVDQPMPFWDRLHAAFGSQIRQIYFPLPGAILGSGRPPQPDGQLEIFLRRCPLPRAVLINPIVLPQPVDEIAPAIIESLKRMVGEFGISSATVSNLLLAARIREHLVDLPLTASILMDIAHPNQVLMLNGLCDTLVPSSRIMRDLPALEALRAAFSGQICLIANEACLPGCPYRTQHFYEMNACGSRSRSLCAEWLGQMPWMRLTGAWVLPQHLHLFDEVCDLWKLSGRVTLQDADSYFRVVGAYIRRCRLAPHKIGGGPASVLEPIEITEEFYKRTLECGRQCHECRICQKYYEDMRLASSCAPRA